MIAGVEEDFSELGGHFPAMRPQPDGRELQGG